MTAKFILVNPHSCVDLITNSSSELFIGKNDQGIEFVKETLTEMLKEYNEETADDLSFDSVFGDVKVVTDYNDLLETILYFGYHHSSLLKGMKPIPVYDYESDDTYEEFKAERSIWIAKHLDKFKQRIQGSIIIESADDNSIPFDLFDKIEDLLSPSHRFHLG